jgi:spore germination protein YaaH
MSINKKYFLIFVISAFFVVPFLCSATSMEKIFYLNQAGEKKGLESFENNADKIDILAPQFFAVNSKMKIVGSFDANLKKIIAQKKVKVMPLVVNASFKQSIIHNLLLSPNDQDAVIKGLIYIAKKNQYIGWQFDFENISYLDKDLYSVFVENTTAALHKNGLILSVAVVTRTTDYEDTDAFKNWGGAYDYARIAKAVDFISLMTYDDPNSVGPVASIPFINGVLAYVKDKIPPEKLSLGIPLYYWKWNADTNKKIGAGLFDNVLAIVNNFNHILNFDQNLGVSCLSYSYSQNNYKIWFEDKDSVQAKLNIIKDNNFRGFSAWILGGEDPAIWTILDKSKK